MIDRRRFYIIIILQAEKNNMLFRNTKQTIIYDVFSQKNKFIYEINYGIERRRNL